MYYIYVCTHTYSITNIYILHTCTYGYFMKKKEDIYLNKIKERHYERMELCKL